MEPPKQGWSEGGSGGLDAIVCGQLGWMRGGARQVPRKELCLGALKAFPCTFISSTCNNVETVLQLRLWVAWYLGFCVQLRNVNQKLGWSLSLG
jgi:hypothetical protein